MSAPLLEVEDLRVGFGRPPRMAEVVHGVGFTLRAGERLGIVGESGSGKSVTALAVLGLLGRHGHVLGGAVRLDGVDLVGQGEAALRRIRGRHVSMVFQDPSSALNPAITVGRQIADVILSHERVGAAAARRRAVDLLAGVGLSDPPRQAHAYPHQLSGGMRQRAMIAMAVACRPRVLIADEPTTALDVTVQAQIVALLDDLCVRESMALLFISHNLDLVAELCDRILVMRDGVVVEAGEAEAIFSTPAHPYTRSLLAAVSRLPDARHAGSDSARSDPVGSDPAEARP